MTAISRQRARFAIGRNAVAAVCAFAVATAALTALRAESHDRLLTSLAAEAAALDDPAVRAALADGYTRVRTISLDDRTTRVTFFDGPRAVAEAAVGPGGRVEALIVHDGRHARIGSDVGQTLPVLVGMTLLFCLATLRRPLAGRRNLDALALAGFTVPLVLLNERYLEWSVAAGGALLAYFVWRCVREAAGGGAPPPEGSYLIATLPRSVTVLVAGGAAVALVLLSIPGGLVSDVGFASLAGATAVLDGELPYGNLPTGELVHGDTYPLLAYLAYVPAALVSPVRDAFAALDGALYVATACALLAALALGRLCGARGVIAFLSFPAVMVAASSGSNDVVAAALVSGGLLLSARAGASAGALAAAGWVKLGPLALLPAWAARYRGRGLAHAAGAAAAVTAATAAAVVLLGGPGGFGDMLDALSFQSERGSFMSVWALLDVPGAQLAFQAAVLTGIVLAALCVWRDRTLAADPRRMAALGAAVLLAVQLAANHWSPTYLAWVFPLVAVALLGGRVGRVPPTPSPPPGRASSHPAARR